MKRIIVALITLSALSNDVMAVGPRRGRRAPAKPVAVKTAPVKRAPVVRQPKVTPVVAPVAPVVEAPKAEKPVVVVAPKQEESRARRWAKRAAKVAAALAVVYGADFAQFKFRKQDATYTKKGYNYASAKVAAGYDWAKSKAGF